jgi:hypothetical protein
MSFSFTVMSRSGGLFQRLKPSFVSVTYGATEATPFQIDLRSTRISSAAIEIIAHR